MALTDDLDAAIAEATDSQAASATVIKGIVDIAQEKNIATLRRTNDEVLVTINLRSTGVPTLIGDKLEELFKLTRGTRG